MIRGSSREGRREFTQSARYLFNYVLIAQKPPPPSLAGYFRAVTFTYLTVVVVTNLLAKGLYEIIRLSGPTP